jgi:hypothetical protein
MENNACGASDDLDCDLRLTCEGVDVGIRRGEVESQVIPRWQNRQRKPVRHCRVGNAHVLSEANAKKCKQDGQDGHVRIDPDSLSGSGCQAALLGLMQIDQR